VVGLEDLNALAWNGVAFLGDDNAAIDSAAEYPLKGAGHVCAGFASARNNNPPAGAKFVATIADYETLARARASSRFFDAH
jgi:hypothetical protein